MDHNEEFVDERQKTWCIHCSAALAAVKINRDHVPSRTLLVKPYPANLPVVAVCAKCNNGFSHDEEYVAAFLGSVLSGTTDPADARNPAAEILARSPKLRARIEQCRKEHKTADGEPEIVWAPELDRVNRVVVKNARGHAFYEHGEPIVEEPSRIFAGPLTKMSAEERREFENAGAGPGWPEVGSRMMTRILTGQDLRDGWIVVQHGVYRYSAIHDGGMLVKSVLFEYLATEVHWEA